MPRFPFCVTADVQRHVKGIVFGTSSKPTSTEVDSFIDDIADEIRGVMEGNGYDTDNIHEVSATVALAITAGSNVVVTPSTVAGFAVADEVKIEGLSSGVRKSETQVIKALSTTMTIATVANNYDAGTVTLKLVNTALKILKSLNAVGAAAKAVESGMLAITPNKSDLAESLREQYYGSEETQGGLWAISHLSNFLVDAGSSSSSRTIRTYLSQNTDIEPVITMDMDL